METLNLREINELIKNKLLTSKISDIYSTIANNPNLELATSVKLAAAYGGQPRCDTFDGWNSKGYRVTHGEHSNFVVPIRANNITKNYRFFAIDQTTAKGKIKNSRTAETLLKHLNSYTIMQTVSQKADFNAIVAAVRNYAAENELKFDVDLEPVIVTGIASILAYSCNNCATLDIQPLPFPEQEYALNAQLLKDLNGYAANFLDLINFAEEKAQKSKSSQQKPANQQEKISTNEIQTSIFDTATSEPKQQPTVYVQPQFSPYYQNYLNVQAKYPDSVVVMRLGDFYEVLGENAVKVAKLLNITLVARSVGLPDRIPMCGFPYYASDAYINKIVKSGINIALAEPLSDTYIDNEVRAVEIKEEQNTPVTDRKLKANEILATNIKAGISGDAEAKFRITSEYERLSNIKQDTELYMHFGNFLRSEYTAEKPGRVYTVRGANGVRETLIKGLHITDTTIDLDVTLSWFNLAQEIKQLIENSEYLTAQESAEYSKYLANQPTPEPETKPAEPVYPSVDNISTEKKETQGKSVESEAEPVQTTVKPVEPEPQKPSVSKVHNAEKDASENIDDLIAEEDSLTFGGQKTRFKDNIEAIKKLKELQESGRPATPEEKLILKKYIGWGGISDVFDLRKENWQDERKELRQYLNDTEYNAAAQTTTDAFYTPFTVIKGIYSALERFGVKGNNRILEPSMGIGKFFRAMPDSIRSGSELHGVEIDPTTGAMAKLIYPDAKIKIKGFEKVLYQDNKFDIVIGNVPFGSSKPVDIERDYNFDLHNFVIAKSVDKVRPGGIVALITTSATMDSWLDGHVRKYLADRAELVGAIRLPIDTFKSTANTQVLTDIIFLQKRKEPIDSKEEWLDSETAHDDNDNYLGDVNKYFTSHPEMVLGDYKAFSTRWGDKKFFPALKEGESLEAKLSEVISKLPENIFTPIDRETKKEKEQVYLPADESVTNFCYAVIDNALYQRNGDVMYQIEIPTSPKDALERISSMIELRNEVRDILKIQRNNCSDEELAEAQSTLNSNYEKFVSKYGVLHSKINKNLFSGDADRAILNSLEIEDPNTKEISKSAIFTKRSIRPYTAPTHTDNAFDALQICKSERGGVDIHFIEDLTGKDFDTILTELDGKVYKDPEKASANNKYQGFESAELYLSGDVKTKLEQARKAAAENADYSKNVQALEAVQPQPIPAEDILMNLGSTWIDEKYYEQYLTEHILDLNSHYGYENVKIHYNKLVQGYVVDANLLYTTQHSERNTNTYGTEDIDAVELFTKALNLKSPNIYDSKTAPDGKKYREFNPKKTALARQRQAKIKNEFKNWIFSDLERREHLTKKYNDIFNRYRATEYDGSHLTFPGMNPEITLNAHQKNAIYRGMSDGTVLLHHCVGAGKTFEMIGLAMKLKQSGLAHKPLMTVPKATLEQTESEFLHLYPNANILVAHKEDFTKSRRQEFIAKVATGDWDSVIMSYEQFENIDVSPERKENKIAEEISKITDTIQAAKKDKKNGDGLTVKRLNSILKTKRAQLEKLQTNRKSDDLIYFEDLGVDYLFVDEAHNFKNKFFFTKMSNVKGIGSASSQRAALLDLKIDYLNELHNGDKGVIFATGTPISNTMSEMYTMQSYLQKNRLKSLGIDTFDNWASTFGRIINSLELKPDGKGYRTCERFASFINLPELMQLYTLFADVRTLEDLNLPVPKVKRVNVIVPKTPLVDTLMQDIAARAERINAGNVDPSIDNMLKVTTDGKKIALDPRLFDISLTEDVGRGKLQYCADKVVKVYKATEAKKSTQIIYCDTSTPKAGITAENYRSDKEFNVYYELRQLLIENGIKPEEIAFAHDYDSDEKKRQLRNAMNSGKIRVLLGSTAKCGTGLNVQKKLIAGHDLDIPYRPSDMEQRQGRVERQGNENDEVFLFTYAQSGTFDAYLFQILETKQRFIDQILHGKVGMREVKDCMADLALTWAEIKATVTDNPRILEIEKLRREIEQYKVLEAEHNKSFYSLQRKIESYYPDTIQRLQKKIAEYSSDIENFQNNKSDKFRIKIAGITYEGKNEETAEAFSKAFNNAVSGGEPFAEYCGFKLSKDTVTSLDKLPQLLISGVGLYRLDLGESKTGNLTRLDNAVSGLEDLKAAKLIELEQVQKDLVEAQERVTQPFEYVVELRKAEEQLVQLNTELNIEESATDDVVIDTENTVDIDKPNNDLYRRLPLEFMEQEEISREIIRRFSPDEIKAAIMQRTPATEPEQTAGIDYENVASFTSEDLTAALKYYQNIISTENIKAQELLQEPLYGLIYNWKGLKDENTVYTAEQLIAEDPSFNPDLDLQDGGFAANKTYMIYKLNGATVEETADNVKAFMTGKKNYEAEQRDIDGWYWETNTENLFTGRPNPTVETLIKHFNLTPEELRMQEEQQDSDTAIIDNKIETSKQPNKIDFAKPVWHKAVLPKSLIAISNDKTVKIKVPDSGIYAGGEFWVSRKFIKNETNTNFKLVFPDKYTVQLKTAQGDVSVKASDFLEELIRSVTFASMEDNVQKPPKSTLADVNDNVRTDSGINEKAMEDIHLSDIRKELVRKVVAAMEKNSVDWIKSWATSVPKNAITGKEYSGINNIILNMRREEMGYTDSRWLTFNQIKSQNWKLKKGSKAAQIEVVKFIDKTTNKEFDKRSVEGMTEAERTEYWDKNVRMMFKGYSVFNASCVEGIPAENFTNINQEELNKKCETIINNSPAKIYYDGGNDAYYSLDTDKIHLPKREQFYTLDDFYFVAFHEMAHSTGHKTRLNRNMTGMRNSENYAKEELCAEFGSLFISQKLGVNISEANLKSSAAYLKSWASLIKKDPKALFKAISEAAKIEQFVVGLQSGAQASNKAMSERILLEDMQRGYSKPVQRSEFSGKIKNTTGIKASTNNVNTKKQITME